MEISHYLNLPKGSAISVQPSRPDAWVLNQANDNQVCLRFRVANPAGTGEQL
jgi:hypothetical protein